MKLSALLTVTVLSILFTVPFIAYNTWVPILDGSYTNSNSPWISVVEVPIRLSSSYIETSTFGTGTLLWSISYAVPTKVNVSPIASSYSSNGL